MSNLNELLLKGNLKALHRIIEDEHKKVLEEIKVWKTHYERRISEGDLSEPNYLKLHYLDGRNDVLEELIRLIKT